MEFVQVLWSSGSIDEARNVARYLVENRLVACAQILPWVESIYMWNNRLDTSQETLVLLKTQKKHLKEIEDVIHTNTSYELPELLVIPIEGGSEKYLSWLEESTQPIEREREQ
jgi:periplasmic divalent cation tolerance protein